MTFGAFFFLPHHIFTTSTLWGKKPQAPRLFYCVHALCAAARHA